ncbi:MAG: L-threonylcarbamoyladenylate synthase [Rickettsiales bacterium]
MDNDFMSVDINQEKLESIITSIQNGGVVIFPTETVFALSARISSAEGIAKIKKIKKRDINKPLSIICKNIKQMSELVRTTEKLDFIKNHSPGAVTFVLPALNKEISKLIGSKNSIGIRIPDHKFVNVLLDRINEPLVATSVNFSGEDAATEFSEVSPEIIRQVDAYYDIGKSSIGIASTVVDLSESTPRILRQGSVKIRI